MAKPEDFLNLLGDFPEAQLLQQGLRRLDPAELNVLYQRVFNRMSQAYREGGSDISPHLREVEQAAQALFDQESSKVKGGAAAARWATLGAVLHSHSDARVMRLRKLPSATPPKRKRKRQRKKGARR